MTSLSCSSVECPISQQGTLAFSQVVFTQERCNCDFVFRSQIETVIPLEVYFCSNEDSSQVELQLCNNNLL